MWMAIFWGKTTLHAKAISLALSIFFMHSILYYLYLLYKCICIQTPLSRFIPETHMAWSYALQFHNISEFHVHFGRCLTCASLSNKAKLAASTALLSPRAATWTEVKATWFRCSFKRQRGWIFLTWYLSLFIYILYFQTRHKSKLIST